MSTFDELLAKQAEDMRRQNEFFLRQGEAIDAAWEAQRKRFFLRRWWDEFTGRAYEERLRASLSVKP